MKVKSNEHLLQMIATTTRNCMTMAQDMKIKSIVFDPYPIYSEGVKVGKHINLFMETILECIDGNEASKCSLKIIRIIAKEGKVDAALKKAVKLKKTVNWA